MFQLRRVLEFTPKRIAAGYAVFGGLWIVISDQLVFALFASESSIIFAQMAKGWVFVGLSAVFLLGLTHVREQQLESSRQEVVAASQQLQVLQRIFRHDIRNDMTVIRGFAALIRERSTGADFDPWLREISSTAGDVIDLSEKLRIVNEVDVRDDTSESVDLVSMIEAELEDFETQYPAVTVDTEVPDQLLVSGNWSIRYAISEALQNAMEHHPDPPADRRVQIAVTESDHEVTVDISDNGPGIPEAEVAPVESGIESQLSHGSGVGLWLIDWLCRSNSGSADFETDDGTTVSMTLKQPHRLDTVANRLQNELNPVPTH